MWIIAEQEKTTQLLRNNVSKRNRRSFAISCTSLSLTAQKLRSYELKKGIDGIVLQIERKIISFSRLKVGPESTVSTPIVQQFIIAEAQIAPQIHAQHIRDDLELGCIANKVLYIELILILGFEALYELQKRSIILTHQKMVGKPNYKFCKDLTNVFIFENERTMQDFF